MEETILKTREYIKAMWEYAVLDKKIDTDFPMPYDFVPPTARGYFKNLYYWDTYFTNIGLYLDGLNKYAYQNIECLKYCLRKFGCVPNCCWKDGAKTASQPPLLFLMVKEYYERANDKAFLWDSYTALKLEYRFWMTKRIAPNGLNRYYTNLTNWTDDYVEYYSKRLGKDMRLWTREQKMEFCTNCNAEGESGEDHTPRFLSKAQYINPIDLNSYLYAFECTMAIFSDILEQTDGVYWIEQAKKRKELIEKYCFDKKTGLYFDYDFQSQNCMGIYCVACYLPFVFGLTDNKKALQRLNDVLIQPHGVLSCQKIEGIQEVFQWGYPNMWAPHQFWAYQANKKIGLERMAEEIAIKYLRTLSLEFEKSGKLFEKYDATVGGKATVNEYGTPEMLGWTAGVFNYFYDVVK